VAKRAALYLAIPALLLLAVYVAFFKPSPAEVLAEKEQRAIELWDDFHLPIETWYFEHDEIGYPDNLEQVIAAGLIEMPINPYTNEPVQVVPFDNPSPGNVSYISRKLVWRYKDGRVESLNEDYIFLVYGTASRFANLSTSRETSVFKYLTTQLPVINAELAPKPNRGRVTGDLASRRYESWTNVFRRAGYVELAKALEPIDIELQRGWTEP
jgi:hypothetical protein